MDVDLYHMPRFRKSESFVMRVNMPRPSEKEPEIKLNPEKDVKISLTFDGHKLVVPMIQLFDSIRRRSLKTLRITFYHDDFDVLRLSYNTECK